MSNPEINDVEGVRLLNVDPGKATNRTVVTFVGSPEAVVEAAFRAIQKAGELIDMSKHKGEHPRMGATDVCPLIPIANITMEETVKYAQSLAKRVGEALDLPVYLYESAQPNIERITENDRIEQDTQPAIAAAATSATRPRAGIVGAQAYKQQCPQQKTEMREEA